MTYGTYNYKVKLSVNRDNADWIENIIGLDELDKYITKLVEADIEMWKKIESKVLQPIVDTEKELELEFEYGEHGQ